MIPPNLGSNDPLTPEQTAMLQEAILSRRKTMDVILRSIEKDKVEVSAQEAAIESLEATLSIAEMAMRTQQNTLSSLIQIKAGLDSAGSRCYSNIPSEVETLCERTIDDVDDQLIFRAAKLGESISELKKYLPRLSLSVQELETELSNRRVLKNTLSQYISDTTKHQGAIERSITMLRSLLNNIRHIPAEVWARIFCIRMHADMTEFFENPRREKLPTTSLNISHVCRFWRDVVLTTGELWHFVPIHPYPTWSPSRIQFLKRCNSLISKPPTLVCNLERPQGTVYVGGSRENGETAIFDAYSVQMILDSHTSVDQTPVVPFLQPEMLTFRFMSAAYQLFLDAMLHPFTEYTGLEVVVKDQDNPASLQLSTSLRHLIYLKFDMTTFYEVDIIGHLGPNLQEFHIRHNGVNIIPPSATALPLPQLKVLGVTPPDTDFTHSLECPTLKKIVLYGPRASEIAIPSLARFTDSPNFKRIRDLEIREWPPTKPGMADEWNVMTLVGDIVDNMRSIESLRYVDSAIKGSELVKLITTLKDTTNMAGSKLEHVVVDCCTGITRDQCDTVSWLVGKMEVYV